MIDLEHALAKLVEVAPEAPEVGGVTRRARQRRSRRRGTTLVAALAVIAVGVAGVVALRSPERESQVILSPTTDSVRVTLLDGSQLEITGPKAMGLTKLHPVFNGELVNTSTCEGPSCATSHSFTVRPLDVQTRQPPSGRYPTGDGHELVVYSNKNQELAMVRYDHWALIVSWNNEPANWAAFAAAIHARETAGGFLVITPEPGWKLGPTDAPDLDLEYGSYYFFGPATYPAGCPSAAETDVRTAQGWPVSRVNGTWWCDGDERVRIRVGDPEFIDEAIQGLRVKVIANAP